MHMGQTRADCIDVIPVCYIPRSGAQKRVLWGLAEAPSLIQEAGSQEAAICRWTLAVLDTVTQREDYGPCGDLCKPWIIRGITEAPLPCFGSGSNKMTAQAHPRNTGRREQFSHPVSTD